MKEVISELSNPTNARYIEGGIVVPYMYPREVGKKVPFKGETNPSDSIIHCLRVVPTATHFEVVSVARGLYLYSWL